MGKKLEHVRARLEYSDAPNLYATILNRWRELSEEAQDGDVILFKRHALALRKYLLGASDALHKLDYALADELYTLRGVLGIQLDELEREVNGNDEQ